MRVDDPGDERSIPQQFIAHVGGAWSHDRWTPEEAVVLADAVHRLHKVEWAKGGKEALDDLIKRQEAEAKEQDESGEGEGEASPGKDAEATDPDPSIPKCPVHDIPLVLDHWMTSERYEIRPHPDYPNLE